MTMMCGATGCSIAKLRGVAAANPPLWTLTRDRSRVTLFGQIALPDGVDWYGSNLQTAFQESEEVWFENPEFDVTTATAAIRDRIALGGPKLGDVMSEADRKRLRHLLRAAGQQEDTFDKLLTWQAYPPISDLIDSINGLKPLNIPERKLRLLAKRHGKRVRSEWSSMAEIMEFSKQQTARQHLDLIRKTLDGRSTRALVRRDALAWAAGDLSAAVAAHERMKSKYPELTTALVSQRNARWIPRIEDMLRTNRSTFVCVGLGHLIGDESIQVLAGNAGLMVKRN